jgi:hypothetical protein
MDLSLKKLEEAVGIRRQIETLEKSLASLLTGSAAPAAHAVSSKGRRRVSATTRAKLAAAARARWAKLRDNGASTANSSKKKKGGLTPSGRKRLSQLMKARWAARRKAASKK